MNIGRKTRRAVRRTVAGIVSGLVVLLGFLPPGGAVEPKGITGITPVTSGSLETAARAEAERRGVWHTDYLRASNERVRLSSHRFRLAAATPQEEARAQGMVILFGSEEVTLNGKRLTRGVDYILNYAEKTLTFTDEVDETAVIVVKYRWAPKPQESVLRSGISGIAGVTGGAVAVAGIGSGVNAIGAPSASGGGTPQFKALTDFRPGEEGPDVRASLLGTNKPLNLGAKTHLELTLTSSREETRQEDATKRRLQAMIMSSSRMALTRETRTRQLGVTRGTQPEPPPLKLHSGEGYRARLLHESGSLQMEANLGVLDRDFDAGMANQFASSLNGMNQNYRGFKTLDLAIRDKQDRFRWDRRAVTGRENGRSMARERWKLALENFSYEADELRIDSEFSSSGGLDQELSGRFELGNQKKVGMAAEQYKAGVSALRGLIDKQETARLALSGSVQATGWRRQITDAQGARLRDQQLDVQVGKGFHITQKIEDIDHNFSKFNETGYKNFAGWAGHRHTNTQYAWQVNSQLSLTHSNDERIVNPSGVAGQGFKSKVQDDVLALKLAKGSLRARQTVTREGAQAAWEGNGPVKMTRERLLELSHQLDRNTSLQLTNREVKTRQGEEEQTYRQMISALATKFKGVSGLSLTRLDEKFGDGQKRVTTRLACQTEMGLTATYDEVDSSNAPTKSRALFKYSRKLADSLVLTAAHRRVRHWNEENWRNENPHLNRLVALQDQEKEAAEGTDLTLAFTPNPRTSATLWHKVLHVKGEGKARAVGLNLSQQLSRQVAFTASTDRWGTAERLGGFNQSYGLKFTGPGPQVEVGYLEGRAAGTPIQPSLFVKASLQPLSGMTLSTEYFNRDQPTTGLRTTKNWSLSQTFAQDGNVSVSYTRNPLNDRGQIVPTAKTRYALTAPSRWLRGKGTLTFAYEAQEASVDGGALALAPYNAWGAPFKGCDLIKTEASLSLKPSKHENLLLTYGRLHGYGPQFASRQGQARYDLTYTREFDADHQLNLKGFVAHGEGRWNQPDLERYRVDLEYRTRF